MCQIFYWYSFSFSKRLQWRTVKTYVCHVHWGHLNVTTLMVIKRYHSIMPYNIVNYPSSGWTCLERELTKTVQQHSAESPLCAHAPFVNALRVLRRCCGVLTTAFREFIIITAAVNLSPGAIIICQTLIDAKWCLKRRLQRFVFFLYLLWMSSAKAAKLPTFLV